MKYLFEKASFLQDIHQKATCWKPSADRCKHFSQNTCSQIQLYQIVATIIQKSASLFMQCIVYLQQQIGNNQSFTSRMFPKITTLFQTILRSPVFTPILKKAKSQSSLKFTKEYEFNQFFDQFYRELIGECQRQLFCTSMQISRLVVTIVKKENQQWKQRSKKQFCQKIINTINIEINKLQDQLKEKISGEEAIIVKNKIEQGKQQITQVLLEITQHQHRCQQINGEVENMRKKMKYLQNQRIESIEFNKKKLTRFYHKFLERQARHSAEQNLQNQNYKCEV